MGICSLIRGERRRSAGVKRVPSLSVAWKMFSQPLVLMGQYPIREADWVPSHPSHVEIRNSLQIKEIADADQFGNLPARFCSAHSVTFFGTYVKYWTPFPLTLGTLFATICRPRRIPA
jgi:hypothetical protein